jgi:glycine cleavage system H protein
VSYIVLACTGIDKPEGSVTREVTLQLAEESGAEIVCPVALNRTPARYKKALAGSKVVVIDGCATQCAGKLAATAGVRPSQKIVVSQVVKELGATLPPDLRLGPDAIDLARKISEQVAALQAREEREQEAEAGREGDVAEFRPASDFVVVVHDKYEFRIPLTGYLFNANDVWVQVAGTKARIGISDYMQQRLTDITYVDPPKVGTRIEQFDEAGTVESTKANFEVVSPVSGTVEAINEHLGDMPEAINEDPYGSWIAELELTNWEEDRGLLVDGSAYAAEVERKAAEDQRT